LPLAFVGAFGLLYGLSWVDHIGQGMFGWAHYSPDPPQIAGLLSRLIPRIPSMNMNIFSQVGLILLVAMVCKNSILIVEFANQLRERGLNARDAVMEAARLRFRPILMTSLSTIAGILPIAIGFGGSAESRRPLGVVAVGGMVSSTFLTLLIIPVIYTLFGKFYREGHRAADDAPTTGPADADTPAEPE
jgi:predicted RND superfamily exporter protein